MPMPKCRNGSNTAICLLHFGEQILTLALKLVQTPVAELLRHPVDCDKATWESEAAATLPLYTLMTGGLTSVMFDQIDELAGKVTS